MSSVTDGVSAADVLRAIALCVCTLGLFVGVWITVYALVSIVSGPAWLAAWGLTGGLVLLSVIMGASSGASLTLRIVAYQLSIVLLFVTFLFVVSVAVFTVTVFVFGALPAVLAALSVIGIVGLVSIAAMAVGLWGAESGDDWALFVRMVAASLSLGIVMTGVLAATWLIGIVVVGFGLGLVLDGNVPGGFRTIATVTTVLTALFAVLVIRGEMRVVVSIEERADASVVTAAQAPHLHAVVNRMAAQLDVPAPTIAVSETAVPEAMVVGYRPSNMHLVVSTGTIESLTDAELTAVLAHELGHVANRDAMVMTAISAPMILSDTLRPRVDGSEGESDHGVGDVPVLVLLVTLYAIFTVPWSISRAIVSMLSREREAAADRVAAETLGSPASLASALRTLDGEVHRSPAEDLRQVSGVSSLSIVPLDEQAQRSNTTLIDRATSHIVRTHPTTDDRIEALREQARSD